eukprot:CAMPEP_0181303338 /NCGR_PEP_ID=MMETSP1101-20121128/8501_1 /TAXON_ID=46948 /ORGANISM="Rhodomonas abbreviata, Strain Caron Lab Isolate" /LENGTH=1216 /DNA_ID=CAMNT_0023408897 /DNA_START=61 /DNA_END=3711 /DNA_ORIENTATION=-
MAMRSVTGHSAIALLALCCAANYFAFAQAATCDETTSKQCHYLAFCEDNVCSCGEGLLGDGTATGTGCSTTGYTARFSFHLGWDFDGFHEMQDFNKYRLNDDVWGQFKAEWVQKLPASITTGMNGYNFLDSMTHSLTMTRWWSALLTVESLFPTREAAQTAVDTLRQQLAVPLCLNFLGLLESSVDPAGGCFNEYPGTGNDMFEIDGSFYDYDYDVDFTMTYMNSVGFSAGYSEWNPVYHRYPSVYAWSAPTTSTEIQVKPTGLIVDRVSFDTNCMDSGCWKIFITYTLGEDNLNVLYIPRAEGDDSLSYDFDYGTVVEDTYEPATHPCASGAAVTACCIPDFLSLYRTTSWFEESIMVSAGDCDRAWSKEDLWDGTIAEAYYEDEPALHLLDFVLGEFSGMPANTSLVYFTGMIDPHINQYTAVVALDEVGLRNYAGMLRGTAGVEHTVDTFIGMANIKPTGNTVFDTAVYQTNIHLEKTSFFSVSTHGSNDYTFLQYINLRLVSIYEEDADFGEDSSEFSDRSTRTNSSNAADYLQVTFTLGTQYQPIETGLIPIDSVRAGQGTFYSEDSMEHKCKSYTQNEFPGRFDTLLQTQTCAPAATMCENPASIPDQFVSFNIPLGIAYYQDPQNDLSSNVFVSLVVSAIDTVASGTPNDGDPAKQMKTTLTASIPIVEGGVNIFCDGLVAKTDLKDVAKVHLIVGSASTESEMSRLTILEDIASTSMQNRPSDTINTDSIESGLMTLVVVGESDYFGNGGTSGYSLELEDVMTVHIMESGTTTLDAVVELVDTAGADNDGADTGYDLNGAFRFTIHRPSNRAYLEPTTALTNLCSFSPTPPSTTDPFPTTCVLRRDVRYRGYPNKVGGFSTAIELAPVSTLPAARNLEATFMSTVLGDSTYGDGLGRDFAYEVAKKYQLDGQVARAWWINPGYEWTPTQTNGQSLFTLSQNIVMFALINLDEGFATGGEAGAAPTLPTRRRLLQASAGEDTGAGAAAMQLKFEMSPQSLMASSFDVPESKVGVWDVEMQLTADEACKSDAALREHLRMTFDDYLSGTTSLIHSVTVLELSVAGRPECRRSLSRALLAFSSATASVKMMVVFHESVASQFDTTKFSSMAGIKSIEGLNVPADIVEGPVTVTEEEVEAAKSDGETKKKEETVSSSNLPLILGVAGGVGGFVLLVGAAFMFVKTRRDSEVPEQVIQTVTIQDLKNQLVDEV